MNQKLEKAADERIVSANLLATKAIEYFLEHLAPVDEILTCKEE